MITARPAQCPKGEIDFICGKYATKKVGSVYRVYADATTYSQTTGQVIKLGALQRDADGVPVKFASVEDAEKWVRGGMIIYPKVQFGVQS